MVIRNGSRAVGVQRTERKVFRVGAKRDLARFGLHRVKVVPEQSSVRFGKRRAGGVVLGHGIRHRIKIERQQHGRDGNGIVPLHINSPVFFDALRALKIIVGQTVRVYRKAPAVAALFGQVLRRLLGVRTVPDQKRRRRKQKKAAHGDRPFIQVFH